MQKEKITEDAIKCCAVQCDQPLGEAYWNEQYIAHSTGWDLGEVSPPIKAYVDQLTNKDTAILIPGCGNSYEAQYLLQKGFTNVTVIDIAPELVKKLQEQFAGNPNINIALGDFFKHSGYYDLILEQTFFCAIEPSLRKKYVAKMLELINENGRLVGLLFNREFDKKGPPFGGSQLEYAALFNPFFNIHTMETCYNSFGKRANTELFINLQKK